MKAETVKITVDAPYPMATCLAWSELNAKARARTSLAAARASANAIPCPSAAAWVSTAATAHGSVPASTNRRRET